MEEPNSKKDKSFSMIKEVDAQDGENLNIEKYKILTDRAEKSLCEIRLDNGYDTGFFCILRYPDSYNKIYCLITNYQAIDNDMINKKEYIEIVLNKKVEKINLN